MNNKSKQIKEILVNLAANNALPQNLNDLDPSIFDHLFQDNPKQINLAETILNHFSERRTDVVELADHYLQNDGAILPDFKPEHRFITATIPDYDLIIEYDTLTTLLSYKGRNEQFLKECDDHDYKDI